MSQKVSLHEIKKFLKLELLTDTEDSLKTRGVHIMGVNRGGLELAGFISKKYASKIKRRIIVLGSKEAEYLSTLDLETAKQRFISIFNSNYPTIIVSSNFKMLDWLADLANEYDYTIFQSKHNFTDTFVLLNALLSDRLAPSIELHAVLLQINGKGVLITGESGVGKSETALELIKAGHIFIGDDRIIATRVADKINGRCSPILQNFLEVRGIGIIDISKMFGESKVLHSSPIDFIVHLKTLEKGANFERLGREIEYREILELNLPYIEVPVSSARNVHSLVETAVDQLILKQKGIEPFKTLQERISA